MFGHVDSDYDEILRRMLGLDVDEVLDDSQ